jgi:hypothetical protein
MLGFATGVACAGEAAHLYLHEFFLPLLPAFRDNILLHRRYIDDGLIFWRGSMESAHAFFATVNEAGRDFGLRVTYDLSFQSAVFLDLRIFKGDHFATTGCLDTEVYQKPMNRYLYIPFRSETPRSTLKGLIKGELLRYIRRSSSLRGFLTIAILFWHRLRARGYPSAFLSKIYKTTPSYAARDSLLAVKTPAPPNRLHTLCLNYSASLARLKLSRTLRQHVYLLPAALQQMAYMQTWRSAARLGSALITYRLDDTDNVNVNVNFNNQDAPPNSYDCYDASLGRPSL